MTWARVLVVLILALASACGGAAQVVPSTAPAATPTGSATSAPASPSASAAAGSVVFAVATGSKAIVRVNEQLADRDLPSDAVLTSEKVTGGFTLQADGTFAASSKIAVAMTALASDNRTRDEFIKRSTLETGRFPQATFVPKRAEGLAMPLAATGEVKFKLIGDLTVHGVTKEVPFDVVATRDGATLKATATVAPALKFADFGMTRPSVFSVISIKDEIRVEVQLTATQS